MAAPSPAPRRRGSAREEVSAGGVVYRRTADGLSVLLIRDGYRNWGFPKGHLEGDESPVLAAVREVGEETGLVDVVVERELHTIDWHFRSRGTLVHKVCHFFLMRAEHGVATPQLDEGITDCQWMPFEDAHRLLEYANARSVLERARQVLASDP